MSIRFNHHHTRTDVLGPFSIRVDAESWGNRYTLVVDGLDIQSWASHPGWGYSCDAIMDAAARKAITEDRCTELLIEVHAIRRAASTKPVLLEEEDKL